MTLRTGRELLMTPGPTMIADSVLAAMHRPAIDVYAPGLAAITQSCIADLKPLFGTMSGEVYLYAANGHGAWEAALTNTLCRGDRILVLTSGLFAAGWGEMAATLGLQVDILPGSWRHAIDPEALAARLHADRDQAIRAILLVQVDTASGVLNDVAAIRRAIDAAGHPALLMVDVIASLGAHDVRMDEWGIDVAVAASQKALGMTPGLGIVAAGPRARTADADLRTFYWDWRFRDGPEHYKRWCGTAPEHLLFGLRQALDLIVAEGFDAVRRRHHLLAEAARCAITVWAQGGVLEFNVANPAERTDSVTVVLMPEGMSAPLLTFCRDICGVTLGGNIGACTNRGFRIGHMGQIDAPALLGTLAVIETGLRALGIPHGQGGTGTAVAALAKALR